MIRLWLWLWFGMVMAGCSWAAVGDDKAVISPQRLDRLKLISQTLSSEIPLVIAHRGASGYLPEHTMEAAAFAHALGADFIEQDVVLTKDRIAVVLHDITLDRVTNVAEVFPDRRREGRFYVFDFTLAELKRLTVLERFTDRKRFPRNGTTFQICTLEDQIRLIQGLNKSRDKNAGIYVELKSPATHREHGLDISTVTLSILETCGYTAAGDRAFVQCFEKAEVNRLRTELKCRLPLIQLLSKAPTADELKAIGSVADGIGISIDAIVKSTQDGGEPTISDVVQRAHEHALMVHAWTFRADDLPKFVSSGPELLELLVRKAGVDGIFSDHPDVLLKWRTTAQRQVRQRGPFHLLNN